MKIKWRWIPIAIVAVAIGVTGCSGSLAEKVPTIHIDVDDEKMDPVDHYLPIDRRAFHGVRKVDLDKALSGDGAMAVAIGNEFANANHLTEARFWYQIAAENGNAIGMNNFAILLEELDCHRANYWLAKAVAAGGVGKQSVISMKKGLEESQASCK
ncbi:hypothetical protein O4D10_09520 [Xanthomonas citri pv. citri]|uniref:hypothetical protein n=1 Tax=Xanthomonas citri TaxID=346 RepID=UPI0036DF3E5D